MKNFSNMTAKEYEKYIENQKKIERDNKIKFIEENIEEVITYILQKDIKNFKKLDVHLQKIILNQELNITYDNKKLYKMLGFNKILSNIIDKYFDSFKNQKKLYNEFDFLTKLQYKKLLKGDPNEDKYTYSFDRKSDKEIIENNLQKENYEENLKIINQLKNLSDNKIIEFINSSNIIKQEKTNYISKKSPTPTFSTSTNNFQEKYGYLIEERENEIYMYDDYYEDMVYYSSKKYFEKGMEYQRKRAEEEYWMDTT